MRSLTLTISSSSHSPCQARGRDSGHRPWLARIEAIRERALIGVNLARFHRDRWLIVLAGAVARPLDAPTDLGHGQEADSRLQPWLCSAQRKTVPGAARSEQSRPEPAL